MIAMTHAGYIVAGYSITFGAIGGYVAWLSVRRRTLARDGGRRAEMVDKQPSGPST